MTDLIQDMYKQALTCGISIDTFWSSSILEVVDYIDAYVEKMENDRRDEVLMLFMLAQIINERHPMVDKEKTRMSQPWDFYPRLFEDEEKRYKEMQQQEELEAFKERRRKFYAAYNARRKGV